jgi:hypothetical protein
VNEVSEVKKDAFKEVLTVGKVIPLQARCGPEGGYRYISTLP